MMMKMRAHPDHHCCILLLLSAALLASSFFAATESTAAAAGVGVGVVNEAAAAAATINFSVENITDAATTTITDEEEDYYGGGGGGQNRMGTTCSKEDIVINQGSTDPLPNGIPAFSVQILNVGLSGCSISNIHVTCGWFSSYRLVNPSVFRRLNYDDCLVNDGHPLPPTSSLSFDYANISPYPLSVSSVSCC